METPGPTSRVSMSDPDQRPAEAVTSLEARLDAFEAERARPKGGMLGGLAGGEGNLAGGWRMVWEVVSGFLGGAAVGWGVDYVAKTFPWGTVAGLVIGSGVAVFMAARTAARMGADSLAKHPAQPVADDDEED